MATIKSEIDLENGSVVFEVFGQRHVLQMNNLSPEVAQYAAYHGMKQKISDAAALSRNVETGASATPAEKARVIGEMVRHFNEGGSWSTRASTGESTGGGSIVLRALAAIQGVGVEEMGERIDRLAERKGTTRRALLMKLAKQPDVAAKVQELRPAPKGTPDADSLLDELGESDESDRAD